jgi:DNA-binding NarL/FixJ family response regulator
MTPAILIVEDQAPMRAELRRFVELAFPGTLVAEAADAMAALVACAVHRPAIVLMDIELPGLDGITLTSYFRHRYGARVIIVSQHAARVYVERASAAGAFGYVAKDNVATELPALVARALAAGRTLT